MLSNLPSPFEKDLPMRTFAPVLLAAAMIVSSNASASAGLFGRHVGGCDSCCDAAPTCCPQPSCGFEPACGCDFDPCCRPSLCDRLRGFFSKRTSHCCEPACGIEPACGCEPVCAPAPACGCEPACGFEPICDPCKPSLLSRLRARLHRHSCCEPACGFEPACGCEPTCGF